MGSIDWIKSKIHEEWKRSLPNRFDSERAKQDSDAEGVTRDYENSYSMHHKTVEASLDEIKTLMERYKRAEQGLIQWDDATQSLYEVGDERPD